MSMVEEPEAATAKRRIAFDLSPEALEQLEALQHQAGAATRAEVVRNALRLYAWFLEQRKQGYEVVLRSDEREKIVELLGY